MQTLTTRTELSAAVKAEAYPFVLRTHSGVEVVATRKGWYKAESQLAVFYSEDRRAFTFDPEDEDFYVFEMDADESMDWIIGHSMEWVIGASGFAGTAPKDSIKLVLKESPRSEWE